MAMGLPMEGLQYFFEVHKQKNNRKKQAKDKFLKGEKKKKTSFTFRLYIFLFVLSDLKSYNVSFEAFESFSKHKTKWTNDQRI